MFDIVREFKLQLFSPRDTCHADHMNYISTTPHLGQWVWYTYFGGTGKGLPWIRLRQRFVMQTQCTPSCQQVSHFGLVLGHQATPPPTRANSQLQLYPLSEQSRHLKAFKPINSLMWVPREIMFCMSDQRKRACRAI